MVSKLAIGILAVALFALVLFSGCIQDMCGNGICEEGESSESCSVDCTATQPPMPVLDELPGDEGPPVLPI